MTRSAAGNPAEVNRHGGPQTGGQPAVVGGRYELGALVGIGSSAQVRQAWDRVSGRPVAVKLFHEHAPDPDKRRHQREMAALARLDHPGLVALHGGGIEAGRAYIVTELVEGSTLAERIAQGPLRPDEVCSLGAVLADALAHVHAGGIVHRDLKPANVLLGQDGRPRLADFGIARALDGTSVTGTGFVVGTAAYLAPEQVRGERVGPPADVYSLGLVLLEALTGRREYPGTAVEAATARLHRPPAVPDVPGLGTLLRAMTALEPGQRPPASAVAATLAADPAAVTATAPVTARRRLLPATPRGRAGLFVTSLGAAAAALVAALVLPAAAAPAGTVAAPAVAQAEPAPADGTGPAAGALVSAQPVPVARLAAEYASGAADAARADAERAAVVERQRAEREAVAKALAEERARAAAERERTERERVEQEAAEREAAERDDDGDDDGDRSRGRDRDRDDDSGSDDDDER